MREIKNLLFLLVISVLIDQSFSSVLWHLEEMSEVETVRNNRKEANFHRGILFSYSSHAKNVLCQDLFHAQLYDEANYYHQNVLSELSGSEMDSSEPAEGSEEKPIENVEKSIRVIDVPTNDGDPTHALVVKKLTIKNKALSDKEDIFFSCAIRDIQSRKPREQMYLLSFAFLSGWFYTSTPDDEHENHVRLRYYMGISPKYVNLELQALEQKYVNMRETMETLEKESPGYFELVVKKDDLSALTSWQKYMLCASILSSPIYRDMYRSSRLEMSKTWMKRSKSKLDYRKKNIFFSSNHLESINMKADCMYCRGYEHSDHYKMNDWTDLCVTRSFEDKNSVYVFEFNDEWRHYYITKYFAKVPVLINAQEIITDGNVVLEKEY